MMAGRMKYRLTTYRHEVTRAASGATSDRYVEVSTIYAERVKMNGGERMMAGEQFNEYRVEYNIRDAHKVAEDWRVREIGGYLYRVVSRIPNKDRGMATLVCERVNE